MRFKTFVRLTSKPFKFNLGLLYSYLKKWIDYLYLISAGVNTKFGYVTLNGMPIINKFSGSKITIDKGVTLISNIRDNVAGISHPVVLATLSVNAEIYIGKDSGLSGTTLCAAKNIWIGEYVGLGADTCIYDTDFHPVDPYERRYCEGKTKVAPVIIDDYAWIGGKSIILKGVRVGKGAVVGAGSVVTKDVPDLTVHVGNPAHFVKKIEYNHETHHNLFNARS